MSSQEEFDGTEVFGCQRCYSIFRRDTWFYIGKPLYNQIKNTRYVFDVYCNECIDKDLNKFFDADGIEQVVQENHNI